MNALRGADSPQRIENAMNVLSFSMLIHDNANTPLAKTHRIHVTIAPAKCAITPLVSRPKKLPAIANTSMYSDKLSDEPRRSRAYVGM